MIFNLMFPLLQTSHIPLHQFIYIKLRAQNSEPLVQIEKTILVLAPLTSSEYFNHLSCDKLLVVLSEGGYSAGETKAAALWYKELLN